jgi:hypothetical protein
LLSSGAVVVITTLGLLVIAGLWTGPLKRRSAFAPVLFSILFLAGSLSALKDEWPLSIMFAFAALTCLAIALKKVVDAVKGEINAEFDEGESSR